MAAKTTFDLLKEAFPGRIELSPREVAQAIYGQGKDTRKRIEQVNRALNEGRLIPGLRKDGARWRIPVAALAQAVDRRTRAVAAQAALDDVPSSIRRSKHSTIGPRMLFQQERARTVLRLVLEEVEQLQAEAQTRKFEQDTGPAQGPTIRKPLRL